MAPEGVQAERVKAEAVGTPCNNAVRFPQEKGADMSVEIQTLLVATDFSDASEAATAYAFQLARTLNAKLYLLHVVPESDVQVMRALRGHLQSHIEPDTLIQTYYADADKRLAQLVESAQAADLVQECLIVTGQPASEIISWASAKQAQIIIVGTHGRSGINRVMMGSVAEHVLRLATCPVLVVPGRQDIQAAEVATA
jgi:nucleotide-binding universal stress UspA family protein